MSLIPSRVPGLHLIFGEIVPLILLPSEVFAVVSTPAEFRAQIKLGKGRGKRKGLCPLLHLCIECLIGKFDWLCRQNLVSLAFSSAQMEMSWPPSPRQESSQTGFENQALLGKRQALSQQPRAGQVALPTVSGAIITSCHCR